MVKPTQHYRWDFIGLSTDTKPTADNSEKVADGSTFYCSDNSKLYVWYDDQWYEKEDTGGGSYVLPIASADTLGGVKVGSGLTINSETGALSVSGGPTTVIQNAGAPTTATEGTVGLLLEDTTNGKLYQCTAVNEPVDENDPTTYTWVEVGQDLVDGVIIKNAGAPTTATVGAIGLLLEDTTNGKLYQCTAITAGVDPDPTTYTWTEVGGGAVTVVQTRGTSQTAVMSQDAATKLVFSPCKSTNPTYHDTITIGENITIDNRSREGVSIGEDITNTGTYAIAIGKSASLSGGNPNGQYSIAIGAFSVNNGVESIALGSHSRIEYSEQGVMDIGLHGVSNQGYNLSNYRKLKGVATMGSNESDEHSAANLAYVRYRINAAGKTSAPTTSTVGVVGGLYSYVDTTGSTPVTKIYQCTDINNAGQYIWVDITTDLNAKINGLILTNAGAPTTATVGTVGQLLEDTTNGKLYQCTAVTAGVDPDPTTYTWTEVGAGGGSGPTVVQTTGNSTTDVMSQDAVTRIIGNVASALNVINNGSNA